MMELPLYNSKGDEAGTVSVDPDLFGGKVKLRLLAEAVVIYQNHRRRGTASAKDLTTIAGSHKKLWRQKGSGRARIGHKRSGHRTGGAAIFGPKPRDYNCAMPQKARRAALDSALLEKFISGNTKIVENISLAQPKTREMAKLLNKLDVHRTFLLGMAAPDEMIQRAVRNIAGASLAQVGGFNALDVAKPRCLLLTKDALDALVAQRKTEAVS